MIYIFLFFLLLPGFSFSETIYLYRMDQVDSKVWSLFISSLKRENVDMRIYRFRPSLEEHLKCVSDVNTKGKGLFLALQLLQDKEFQIFIAVSSPKQVSGSFLKIDEIPTLHFEKSFCVAKKVAGLFKVKPVKLPLFPLLGVNMPGIFIFAKGPKEDLVSLARVIIEAARDCEYKE